MLNRRLAAACLALLLGGCQDSSPSSRRLAEGQKAMVAHGDEGVVAVEKTDFAPDEKYLRFVFLDNGQTVVVVDDSDVDGQKPRKVKTVVMEGRNPGLAVTIPRNNLVPLR